MEIKLEKRFKNSDDSYFTDEYTCKITDFLGSYRKCYLYDARQMEPGLFMIRVPGRTIGGIWCDPDMRINNIHMDESLCGDWFPENTADLLNKCYAGVVLKIAA